MTVYVFFFRYLGRGWFARILCLYTGSENHTWEPKFFKNFNIHFFKKCDNPI